jgi:hypothetical protein
VNYDQHHDEHSEKVIDFLTLVTVAEEVVIFPVHQYHDYRSDKGTDFSIGDGFVLDFVQVELRIECGD